ncbi:imidazole glycerol phosphate synthase subunit HisH [Bythopirellula polymerisocia]|uniref:Imidazole glycerol phosphate synthase subunit HisH n=1 Tax=Bythopirellula polymerisocia TaxID=2528003 RepID=A0A5C6CLQ0_9BACT|nr:imidazole glycerol phosphate synthase subunit HisH [Bythopirellula polymerisocia]TWU24487.1 Imidazole glycerol phosphate synthase subunit HisH 1 [Bythopirellula polymerisocia]
MIAIIDYQMGNLRSVQKGFERVGHAAAITSDPEILSKASHIVLPGVGAFADAIAELKRRDLVGPIGDAVSSGKPFLGICLGLQLLFERSFEDGEHEGLGILSGEVRKFDIPREYKVPHMGWNQVHFRKKAPIFAGINDEAYFYFVHSYFVVPKDPGVLDGEASYPNPFCATIWRENLFATQFHPEKSQSEGLRVLRNFAELA